MNNQWRDNANCMVVWADGTYDSSRLCTECNHTTCKSPVHRDQYKEVGEDPLLQSDQTDVMGYWSWMAVNKPLGSKQDFDGEWVHTEFAAANADCLCVHNLFAKDCVSCRDGLTESRSSGIDSKMHELAQKALDILTDKQKEIWQLVMREQLSQTQVGKKLGISQQSVEKHLRYARAKFTEYLRGDNESSNA